MIARPRVNRCFSTEARVRYTCRKAEGEGIVKVGLVIYVKPGCPYCQQARDHYNSEGVAFTEYDAQNDRARRKEMFDYSGGDPTVPCVVEDGRYVQSGWGDPPRG
jgi:glutaredoxin 3